MIKKTNSYRLAAAMMLAFVIGLTGCASNAPIVDESPTAPIDVSPTDKPLALIKTRAGDLTLRYANGEATLAGTLQRSTPCVDWKIRSRVLESFPEQVIFEVNDESTAQMCVQMLGEPQEVRESVNVSEQASFRVLFEGEEIFSGQIT